MKWNVDGRRVLLSPEISIRILAAGLEGAVFGSAGPALRRTHYIEMAHAEVGEVDEGLGLGSIPLVSRMSYVMPNIVQFCHNSSPWPIPPHKQKQEPQAPRPPSPEPTIAVHEIIVNLARNLDTTRVRVHLCPTGR